MRSWPKCANGSMEGDYGRGMLERYKEPTIIHLMVTGDPRNAKHLAQPQ